MNGTRNNRSFKKFVHGSSIVRTYGNKYIYVA